MAAAMASGTRREDVSQRTEAAQVFANPDGTWTSEAASGPVRVQDDQGSWHDIDTTLVEADGRIAPKYAATDVTLSDGGDKVFAAVSDEGKDLSWSWPTVLPKPTIEGDTATYADVLPNADLIVKANATGFSHSLVLREAPAEPLTIAMPVATDGTKLTENAGGDLTLKDAKGEVVAAAPAPIMYDSSNSEPDEAAAAVADATEAAEPGAEPVPDGSLSKHVAPVDVTVTAPGGTTPEGKIAGISPVLTLSPDQDYLTDPATKFPVVIDPSYTTVSNGDTWIMNADYTTSQAADDHLRVGTWDSGVHKARSFLTFNMDQYLGKQIISANLMMWNWAAASCTGSPIYVSRMVEPWSGTTLTWGNQPAANGDPWSYTPAYGAAGCAAAYANWNIKPMVTSWANGTPNYGLRLLAGNENINASWRRYRSINWAADASVRPHISVTYNTPPEVPSDVTVDPGGTGYTSTQTPTLSAGVSDVDGGEVRAKFDVMKSGVVLWSGTSPYVPSGSAASVSVPPGNLAWGDTVSVVVTANDGVADSSSTEASLVRVSQNGGFVPATPTRLVDTVAGVGLPAGNLQGGGNYLVQIAGSPAVPVEATAVFAHIRVVDANSTAAEVRVGASGATLSTPSVSISAGGYEEAGLRFPLGNDGKLQIATPTSGSSLNVTLDVEGYFVAEEHGTLLNALSSPRVYDTHTTTPLAPGETREVQLTGIGGIPIDGGPEAVDLMMTASDWTATGMLSVANPDDEGAGTSAVLLKAPYSTSASSRIIVQPSLDSGMVLIKNESTGTTHVTLDALGWYGAPIESGGTDLALEVTDESPDETVQEILALNPGTTVTDVQEGVAEVSAEAQVPFEEAADAMRDELHAAAMDAAADEGYASPRVVNMTAVGWLHFSPARRAGDVFYSPNTKYRVIVHGHAGIFSSTTTFVEAPGGVDKNGLSRRVREVNIRDAQVVDKAEQMEVLNGSGNVVSANTRKATVAWARSRIGDKYNGKHWSNTHIASGKVGTDANRQDCAQLVWAAYKKVASIDLNPINYPTWMAVARVADILSVFPSEIRASDRTRTYKVMKSS